MTATAILTDLMRAGIEVRLKDATHLAVPAGSLTPEQRALLLSHRDELIAYLIDARNTTAALINAAMQTCDVHGDSESARQQMRRDVEATPPHLRADLLDHLTSQYPRKKIS